MSLSMTELPPESVNIFRCAEEEFAAFRSLPFVPALKTSNLRWPSVCTISFMNGGAMERAMKMRRTAVSYRENCGGMLRNLASGFDRTIKSLADIEMYEDLRERIFKKAANHGSEPGEPFSR
jgi:hypothetical protein